MTEVLERLAVAESALADIRRLLETESNAATAAVPGAPRSAPLVVAGDRLKNPAALFRALRGGVLGPALSQDEVDGCTLAPPLCAWVIRPAGTMAQ